MSDYSQTNQSFTKSPTMRSVIPTQFTRIYILGTKDSLTDTSHHPQDNQSDQMQRAVVLEHRRVPRDVNDRLQKLEIRVGEMARVLDMVRAQVKIALKA